MGSRRKHIEEEMTLITEADTKFVQSRNSPRGKVYILVRVTATVIKHHEQK